MSGRARGRGVARGRGAPAGGMTEQTRRPGEMQPPKPMPQQGGAGDAGNGHSNNGAGTNGAGRASHRGGARGEPKPGAGVTQVETQMSQMSIGTQDAGQQRRGRREISYTEPHTRPAHIVDKRGKDGNPVEMMTNYYKIVTRPDWHLYQYHVDFNPPIDSRKLRKGMLYEHAKMFKCHLFDGMQLYSATKLDEDVTEFVSTRNYDGAKIRITVKRVAELAPSSPVCIQILNVLQRQILSDLEMKEVQRSYFAPQQAIKLPQHKLEIWPGFKTSILQYEEHIMLNIDVSHKVLRLDSVLDFMYEEYNKCRGGPDFKSICVRKLVGEIVMTRYNDKTYRVDDIDWDINPAMTFKRKDDEISYKDYYKTVHGIDVRDMQQPMLVSRPKKKDQRAGAPEMLYLLPELCTMTGLTDETRADFSVMKDLAVYTRVDPTKRAQSMNRFMTSVMNNENAKQRLDGWGVKYSPTLLQLQGRQFLPEKILLGPDRGSNAAKEVDGGQEADWGRALRGRMYTTVNLSNWLLVYFEKNEAVVSDFYQTLTRVAPPMGVQIGMPKRVKLNTSATSAYLEAIRSHVDPSLQMVVAVLPSNKKDLYDAIKKQCCVDTPVSSQCVTFNVLKKPKGLMSVVSKIAIQLNCKLGGEAWAVQIPVPNNMVVGIDTYHDSAKKGRSVGGFVASLNKTFTRYYSQTIFQSNMQELIDGLRVSMQAALKKYHSVNGSLPNRILVYRDGVGDGQLPAVVEHEVPQLLEATKAMGSGYNPEIVIVVVKKRINTRFFRGNNPSNLSNPGPGTIVDYEVTRPESYDFFMVSQSVRQGTVSPTHFNVIWDTSQNLGPGRLQKLTYKLCHLYYNWPGTIRVPAPCQYAHKLAFLTGQSIHKQPDLALADKLYYL